MSDKDTIYRQDAIEALIRESTCDGAYGYIDTKSAVETMRQLPSAEPEIIRCKDCKYRYEEECPMRYEEWVSFEEDGYIESDNIAHDQTRDDGFCDRGEVEE